MKILRINRHLYRVGIAEGSMQDVAAMQQAAGHETATWGRETPETPDLRDGGPLASSIGLEPPPGAANRLRGRRG